jgi:O-antigen/teichoic acid export membrane protein
MTVAVARPPEPQPLHRLARAGFLSLGGSVAIQGLNVVSGVILARALGPSARGELAAVLLWPGILAAVGGLSTAEGVAYFTARASSPTQATAATALAISLAQAIVLMAAGYLLMPVVLGHYGVDTVRAGRLYLLSIAPYLLGQAAMAVLQGRQRWMTLNLVRVVITATTVAGLVLLLSAGRVTVLNATALYIVVAAVGLAATVAALAARGWLGVRPDARLGRSITVFGLKAHVGSLAGQANLNLDKAAIAVFLSSRDLGVYAVAVTLSAPLTMIGTAIGTVALPAVAASASAPERRHAFAWLVRSTLVLSTVTAVTLVVLTPLLMRTFFGVGFLSGVLVAQVAITAALVRGVGYVLAYGLCAFNRPLAPSIAEVLAVVATAIGLAALLPSLGLVGAAITSLAAYSVSAAYMLWFAQRRLEMPLADLLLPRQGDIGEWIRCVRR